MNRHAHGQLSRRVALCGAVAAVLGACAQGKIAHTVAFEVADEGRAGLTEAMREFAAREVFKLTVDEYGMNRFFLLTRADIDISFGPVDSEPAHEGEIPPHVSPVRYEAAFYIHTPNGLAPQMDALVAAFNIAISSVHGVRKTPPQ